MFEFLTRAAHDERSFDCINIDHRKNFSFLIPVFNNCSGTNRAGGMGRYFAGGKSARGSYGVGGWFYLLVLLAESVGLIFGTRFDGWVVPM